MRKSMGAAIALTLGCILALGISACGGGGDSTSTSSETTELSGTVEVWDLLYKSFPEYTEAIDQVDAEFEDIHPGVTVKRVAQVEEGYAAKVRTALIAGEVPDVMTLYTGYGVLAYTDWLEVLNDRISPELEDEVALWSAGTPGLKEDGDHYAVPLGLNGAAFYYNKKLFAKAGLPTDFQPESWQELREAGETLKAAGIQPFADGDQGGQILSVWMYGLGLQTELSEQELAEMRAGELPYTSEAAGRGFAPLTELYDADLYRSELFTTEFISAFSAFEDGEAAMVLGLWSVIGSYAQFNPKLGEKNVGVFRTPGSPNYSVFASAARTIPAAAGNKDAAWALLEFEVSKKTTEKLLETGNILPIRKDVPPPAGAPIQERELVSAAQNGEVEEFPLTALSPDVEITVSNEFSEILLGRTSVEEVQKAMQDAREREEG